MNEPTIIKKFNQVCDLNCKHMSYCVHHAKKANDSHWITPTTAMKKAGKGIVEWLCKNFLIPGVAPAKPT